MSEKTVFNPCRCSKKGGCNPTARTACSINSNVTPVIWVLGGPASGKTTQCGKIVERYGVTLIKPGELLRHEAKGISERAKTITPMIQKHEIIPADIVAEVLRVAMAPLACTTRGYVLDEFPRDRAQISTFHKVAAVTAVLYLELPEEKLVENYQKVDKSKALPADKANQARVKARKYLDHIEELKPMLPSLIYVDASKTIDEVYLEVTKVLDPFFIKHLYT